MAKTNENLMKAFANEAQASLKYKFYAEVARSEGLDYYATLFEEAARNEESHAREMFLSFNGFQNTITNLKTAIQSEKYEAELMYPDLSETALADGDLEAARIFKQIAKIEKQHNKKFEKMLKLLNKGNIYKREKEVTWKCSVCGYTISAKEPPKKCPACRNGREKYFPSDFNY